MLGGEVVDHLNDGILQRRQGAGGGQAGQPFFFHRLGDCFAALQEALLDQHQASFAQGTGIGRVLGQRGQGKAQGIGVNHVARGKCLWFFQAHGGVDHVMGPKGLPLGQARCGPAFFAGFGAGLSIGRGGLIGFAARRAAGPRVRTTTPQAMRSPALPMGWVR